jgi:hypothetical protein
MTEINQPMNTNVFPIWEQRSQATAHLINPAFCAEVIRHCITAYAKETKESLPFSLSFVVLPLVLNNSIRKRLPKNKSNTFHSWMTENQDLKIGLPKEIAGYMPFTREALMFAIAHGSLSIDDTGRLVSKQRRTRYELADDEMNHCLNKSKLIGKLLAKSGNAFTLFSIFGIKP